MRACVRACVRSACACLCDEVCAKFHFECGGAAVRQHLVRSEERGLVKHQVAKPVSKTSRHGLDSLLVSEMAHHSKALHRSRLITVSCVADVTLDSFRCVPCPLCLCVCLSTPCFSSPLCPSLSLLPSLCCLATCIIDIAVDCPHQSRTLCPSLRVLHSHHTHHI